MQKSNKKIALIGNMNNCFSAIARYMADYGYNVDLIQYRNSPEHFKPEADSMDDYWEAKSIVINWWDPGKLYDYDVNEIVKDVEKYDFIIACSSAPAFLSKANINLDIFIPYGSDIYSYPFLVPMRNPLKFLKRLYFIAKQRKGIAAAKKIIMEKQSPAVEKKINKLVKMDRRITTSVPMIYAPQYQNVSEKHLAKLVYYPQYAKIRQDHEIVIFHHCRHSWKNPKDPIELKGNDRLLRGFAAFKKMYPAVKACIVTLEYGAEVDVSKQLISELGIEENVFWFPKQNRKELMMGIGMSDVVVGEIYGSYNLYGVISEALVMSKPVMHYRNDEEFVNSYPELYPMIRVVSSDEVCESLIKYHLDPEKYKEMGIRGRKWYDKYIVESFFNKIAIIMGA